MMTGDENPNIGKVLLGAFGIVLILGALIWFSVSPAKSAEEGCASPQLEIAYNIEYAKGLGIEHTKMDGKIMRAFESVVQSLVESFKLEATTEAVYFFEVKESGQTVIMEVDGKGCVLNAAQVPTQQIKTLIDKMSATL